MRLLEPLAIGDVVTQHRIVMAPLTRFRAGDDFVPSDLQLEYYSQRSSYPGTLLISEATYISKKAGGYFNAPGIWDESQIRGWKKIADKVHDNGCYIFMQLWSLGRVGSSLFKSYLGNKGLDVVAPSPIPDHTSKDSVGAREMTIAEIEQYIRDYAQAAKNAVFKAGCDGVEIQAGNGYLLDQFLHENSNKRTDKYGGSVQNRCRFLLQVIDCVIQAVGSHRVAIRLSPWERFQGMDPGKSPLKTVGYILLQLELRAQEFNNRLAYVHTVEPTVTNVYKDVRHLDGRCNDWVRTFWKGVWIRAGGYNLSTAINCCDNDPNTLVAFGRLFISNPNLVKQIMSDLPLAPPPATTDNFYTGGEKGYTDYVYTN